MKKSPLFFALLLLFLMSCKDENKEKEIQQEPVTEESGLIAEATTKKAFNTDNLALQTFTFDAGKDNKIKGEEGTELTIPKNTFVDAQGNTIKGNVTLELKEALSMSDILMAGLITTSNGEMLCTGGMLYINAKQGDADVYIARSKSVEVSVPADDYKPQMQVFTGEEDTQGNINWVNPEDIIKKPVTVLKKEDGLDEFGTDYEPEPALKEPVKPVKNNGGLVLTINLANPEWLPEFAPFKDVSWKVIDEKAYSNEDSQKVWKHVMVERSGKEGVYLLTFKGTDADRNDKRQYEVIPVFEGEDFDKAMTIYNQNLAAFEKEKKEREAERKESERRWMLQQQNKANIDKAKNFANRYVFPASRFGWINCDYFYKNETVVTEVIVRAFVENPGENDVYLYMVINKDSCLPGYADEQGGYVFNYNAGTSLKLPLGIPVTIYAVSAEEKDNMNFGSKEIIISKENSVSVQLNPTTKQNLKKTIIDNLKQ